MSFNTQCIQRVDCRVCRSDNLERVIELTPTPPGNNFLHEKDLGQKEELFPLNLNFCKDCYHLQLGHIVDPKFLFQNNYSYVSATSEVFVKHLKDYADYISDFLNLNNKSFVVDIGSNDGTCLKGFKEKGMSVLGIDPARHIAEAASLNGIETIANFFSYGVAQNILKSSGKADLITSHNACAHIDDLDEIIKGVSFLLKENGVFIMEVGYFLDVFTHRWFDTIYHEHLDFHTVAPFERLFARVGMEVIGVQRIAPQGGSIRVMTQKRGGKFQRDASVDVLISLERELGFDKAETLEEFDRKISSVRKKLQTLVRAIKAEGKTIAGFGAPTKATTLMGHFGLDETVLDFIVDDNPLKQNLYTPISHIPILAADALYTLRPDYVIVLAWNFAEPIIKAHKMYSQSIGKFILPMPNPYIVE